MMHADRYTIKAMVLTAGLSAAAFAQYANTNSPLAINLGGIAEWGTEIAFFDMFRMFRGWENHGAADGITPMEQLDEYGWPTYVNAGQELTMGWGNCPIGNKYPSGRYLLTWEGEGTFSARNGCSFVETDLANRRIVISVDSTVAWWGIRLNTTNPSNYAKNMRCYLPGFWDEATYRLKPQYTDDIPWHPNYLDNLRRFKAFRFMDLLGTNGSPVIEWEDFKPSTYYNQGGANHNKYQHCYSPLMCIRLSNHLHADAWVCIPHQASDACVRSFAELLRDSLDPDLNVYVEYSNECWNWMFPQTAYCRDKAKPIGLPGDGPAEYFAYRNAQIWQIFDEVFGGRKAQVKKVLAWQTGTDFSWHFDILNNAAWNPTNQKPDFCATAPYIHNGTEGVTIPANIGADAFLDRMRTELVPAHREQIQTSYNAAVAHGCKLIAYEAGQHFVSNTELGIAFFREVNAHPKMKEAYLDYMNMWREETDNGLMAMFSTAAAVFLQGPAAVTVDPSTTYQTVEGLGCVPSVPALFQKAGQFYQDRPTSWEYDRMCIDLGISGVRFQLATETSYLARGVYDWMGIRYNVDFLRQCKARGVERYIITILNPPGWAKTNGIISNGGNLLDAEYDGFAEYMAQMCKAFKDSVGVEPYGLCVQNEPNFPEPYGSCVYSDADLSRLSSLTKARLTNLGLTTRLFAASDVCGIGLDWPQCQQNPDIHAYAVHNECPGWDAAAAYAQAGNKRAWMTEHDCAAQDKLIAPTDYLKPAAYADTTGWAHPRVIDAYDPGAGPGSFIFPGDFWFRTTFTSQQSGTVRPAGKLTERDRVVSVKLFTLQGREITGELRMVPASIILRRTVYASGRTEQARIVRASPAAR